MTPNFNSRFKIPSFPVSSIDNRHIKLELPLLWWLIFPLGFFILRYSTGMFTDKQRGLESIFLGELGIVENLTVLFLLLAIAMGLRLLIQYRKLFRPFFTFSLVFYCLGCIYFAGEEASWGQHWFKWTTGEYFLAINDQQETNFHNSSDLLDRVPKSIVSLGIFLGGVVVPITLRRKHLQIDPSKPLWWVLPTWVCLPTAILATIATWPSKIENVTGWVFYFDQAQETKEFYIAYFILIAIASLSVRIQKIKMAGQSYSPL